MNKTVNINLAGISFHIDENAYGKLSRYLEAIRRSLRGAEGSEEIMQDIESRIGELFSEKIEFPNQVIGLKELDEVIAVMGQPEDYEVDDEIFEDAPPYSEREASPKSSNWHKQLFRDVDNKYIAGVSSGLGHYLGIDAVWIRLLWVLLVVAGMGYPILIYILLWILVPPALTTSQKLKMTGEPINISNIERKFKESFDTMADHVKNADYDKYGNKIKTGASRFFDSLGEVMVTLFKVFAKLIGIFMILVSLAIIFGLILGFFTLGSMDFWGTNALVENYSLLATTNIPLWLIALMGLFAIGIPFFALFVLGLKLLVSNLKPMNTSVKIVLTILWALSIIGLSVIGIKQATEQAYDGSFTEERTFDILPSDTLRVVMKPDIQYSSKLGRSSGLEVKYDKKDQRIIYSKNIRLDIKPSNESTGKIIIEKTAEGNDQLDAKKRAQAIEYYFELKNGTLELNGFFTTNIENKFRDQAVEIIIFVPEGTVVFPDENAVSYYNFDSELIDLSNRDNRPHYYKILHQKSKCLDCPGAEETSASYRINDSLQPVLEKDSATTKTWEQEVQDGFNKENIKNTNW